MPSSGHAGQAIVMQDILSFYTPAAPVSSLAFPSTPLSPAKRGTLARAVFWTSTICTTLYFLSYIHTATAVPLASLIPASFPAAYSEYHVRWRHAGTGQGMECVIQVRFSYGKRGPSALRVWAWRAARAGDTLLLALSAGADAGADAVISDLHVCACSIAARGRFGRRGREIRYVLLHAVIYYATWRYVASLTTGRHKTYQEGTMVRCEN